MQSRLSGQEKFVVYSWIDHHRDGIENMTSAELAAKLTELVGKTISEDSTRNYVKDCGAILKNNRKAKVVDVEAREAIKEIANSLGIRLTVNL